MTAAIVDGVEVVASEPAVSPLTKDPDKPIYYKQVMRLLLSDESIVYGCAHCDYTGPTTGHIWPHLKVHKAPEPSGVLPEDMTIGELFREHQRADSLAAALDKMTDSRNDWKARAQAAEKQLGTLRTALRGVSL